MGRIPIHKPILILVLSFAAIIGFGERHCHAQFSDSGLASILPLNSFQGFFGPLLPPEGISSTFRSELGLGGGMASLLKANVKNGNTTFNLLNNGSTTDSVGGVIVSEFYVPARSLDGAPSVFQFYSKTRLWRLAFNASYTFFDTYSRRSTDDGVFFSGPILGGDIDLIHNGWLAAGISANFYLNQPQFVFKDPSSRQVAGMVPLDTSFYGSAPSNIGVYVRYTPPEIWNFPLHLEAHYYMPFGGSKWTSWGFALAFRPQIYRFDLSARLKLDNQYLNINGTDSATANPNWEADFQWSILGMDVGVYF